MSYNENIGLDDSGDILQHQSLEMVTVDKADSATPSLQSDCHSQMKYHKADSWYLRVLDTCYICYIDRWKGQNRIHLLSNIYALSFVADVD